MPISFLNTISKAYDCSSCVPVSVVASLASLQNQLSLSQTFRADGNSCGQTNITFLLKNYFSIDVHIYLFI
jgi:hypothetical protein